MKNQKLKGKGYALGKLCFLSASIFMLASCQVGKQYALSEQMVNHYLHGENEREIKYTGTDSVFVDFSLDDMNVDIGRNLNKSISANCIGKLVLHFPQGQKKLTLNIKFSGKPELRSDRGAVYLVTVNVDDYQIRSKKNEVDARHITAQLDKIMQAYFDKYPIYLVDSSSFIETQALTGKTSFVVEKGQLRFSL